MRLQELILITLFLIVIIVTTNHQLIKAEGQGIIVSQMSTENKKIYREKLVQEMLIKFREDQTFDKINEYMLSKANELNKATPRHMPDYLIEDTFSKTDNLIERTRFAVKENPSRFYEPISFEKSVQKLLWLKGVCFLVMGIKEEHQMAFSYFYLPGNEYIKHQFLEELVGYSFPEVPNIPENEKWRQQMTEAMSRLGYRIFSVKKFGIENN